MCASIPCRKRRTTWQHPLPEICSVTVRMEWKSVSHMYSTADAVEVYVFNASHLTFQNLHCKWQIKPAVPIIAIAII